MTATDPGLSLKQQDSILDADASLNIWEGSIRSGKTIASIVRWLLFVRDAPVGALAIIGKTRDTIGRNVLDVISDIQPAAIAYNRGAPTCRILGRTVHVIGANDAKAEGKVRGLTLAGAYVDEITLLSEHFWNQLLARLSVTGAKLFGTTNPDNPQHWLKKNFLDKADNPDLDLRSFHFVLDDNPAIPEQKKRQYKASYVGLWYKRFILGQWKAAEGAIYEMLDEDVHCRPAPPSTAWMAAWLGVDFGTSNPTHAVLMVLAHDSAGQPALYVVSEWQHDGRVKGQLTTAQQSARMAKWAEEQLPDGLGPVIVLDPSAAPLRVQMRSDGWPGLRSADNRVDVGLQTTAALFGGHRLYVDQKTAPVLWDELCGYVWSDTARAKGKDEPVKTADHGPDALRYAIMAARSVWREWLPALAAEDVSSAA